MKIPSEFFTVESFFTFTGALTIVFVICNTSQAVFNFRPKWFVLIVSICISLIGVSVTNNPTLLNYLLGVVNGCLICLTALGSNMVINKSPVLVEEIKDPTEVEATNNNYLNRRLFFSNWFQ